jgi:hypothetical protein
MGQKSEPSPTSGGIGITQEVTNIGGMSVSAGANIDITPLDFGISVDPSEGTVSLATGAEVPGGLLGISGGITIDTNTGEVIGGSIGAEVGGLGINISNSKKGGLGIEFTVQIPGTPIELSLGLGFPPKGKQPTSTPTPSPTTPRSPPTRTKCSNGSWIVGGYIRDNFLEGKNYLEALAVGIKFTVDYSTIGYDEELSTGLANNVWGVNGWFRTEIKISNYFPTSSPASNSPSPTYVGEWYFENDSGKISYGGRRRNNVDGTYGHMLGKWTCTLPRYNKKNENAIYYSFNGLSYDWEVNIEEVLPAPPCPLIDTPTPTPPPTPPPPHLFQAHHQGSAIWMNVVGNL